MAPSGVNFGGHNVPEEDLVSAAKRLLKDRFPLRPSHKWRYLEQNPEAVPFFPCQHEPLPLLREIVRNKKAAADFSSISDKEFRFFSDG